MRTIHELKTWPPFFEDVRSGRKCFEFRKNDRDYAVGDHLVLLEFLPDETAYTGRICVVRVTYLVSDAPGLPDGYVIMGVELIEEEQADAG